MTEGTPNSPVDSVPSSQPDKTIFSKTQDIAIQTMVTCLLICTFPIAIWVGGGIVSIIMTMVSVVLLTLSLIVTLGSLGSVRAVLFSTSKNIDELWLNSTYAVLGLFVALVLWTLWKMITPGVFEAFLLSKIIGFLQLLGSLLRGH